jgi:hypothetical protein
MAGQQAAAIHGQGVDANPIPGNRVRQDVQLDPLPRPHLPGRHRVAGSFETDQNVLAHPAAKCFSVTRYG